jgi:hypothetical protein
LVCFYVLLISFGVRPYLAVAGAIAYGFSTYFMVSIEAGHLWKMRAIAYAPLVIAGVHLAFSKKYLAGFALTSLALALEINSNHIQITYYLALCLLIYGIVHFIFAVKEKELKPFLISTGFVLGAALLAVGANFGKLWSTYEYGKYSIRGKSELSSNTESSGGLDREYAFQWSSGKAESFTLLIPNFYGGASGNYTGTNSELERVLAQNNVPQNQIAQYTRGLLGYWGPQPFTSGPVYAGAIICFLFIIGILYTDKRYKWWLISATLLSLVLSWGKNFPELNYFLFDHLPLYNKFRAVSMTVVIALITMPLLGLLGLEKLLGEPWDKKTQMNLWVALGVTGGFALLIAIVAYVPAVEGDQFPEWLKQAINASRKSIIRNDVIRALFFIAAASASLFFYFRKKLGVTTVSFIILALIAVDNIGINYRYINKDNYISQRRNTFLTQTPADKIIRQDKSGNYRVLNLQNPFNDARTSAFHHSVGGYHGAKMRRYQDFISQPLQNEINSIIQEGRVTEQNTRLISMLNTKYLLAGLTEDGVIRNPYPNGNAWFIETLLEVDNADEELEKLSSINPRTEAVIDVSNFIAKPFAYDSASTAALIDYTPNKLTYQTTAVTDGYVVFSEIYYPEGWTAYIDGEAAAIDRVNYILRGMHVPAGEHKIEFRFKPASYFVGNKIMLVSNVLLLLVVVAGLFWTGKQYRESING